MNIDVKESNDGDWFYSFAIEKGIAPQTLLAVVTDESATIPYNSISNSNENVNIKKSLEVDREGTKLSVEQIKRYKNVAPELRDEQGRIKPFYHGTSKADVVMRSGEVAHPI